MLNKALVTTLLVLAVLALAAASGVRAADLPPQLAQSPETLADEFLHGLSARVVLTPQEATDVRVILLAQIKKRQEVARARLAASPGMAGMLALREDMRAIGQETDTKLAAVLPPGKLTAVRAYRDQRRQELQARVRQARNGG